MIDLENVAIAAVVRPPAINDGEKNFVLLVLLLKVPYTVKGVWIIIKINIGENNAD